MLKHELEALLGTKLTDERYLAINAIYEEVGMNKQEFCRNYHNGMEENSIVLELMERLKISVNARRKTSEAVNRLGDYIIQNRLYDEDEDLEDLLHECFSSSEIVVKKIYYGSPLNEYDRDRILKQFGSELSCMPSDND